jgi:AcrR family transcriptional regulator
MTSEVRSPRKPKGQGAERREEILAAALRLFTEHGVDAVSTRDIAQAVGVSQPTLYAYFPSKDEIGRELHQRAFALLAEKLAARSNDPFPQTLEEAAAMMRVYIDFGLDNPEMYQIAFMTVAPKAWQTPHVEPDGGMSPMAQSTFGVLAAFIADLKASGRTVDVDAQTLAQSIWASMHGLVSLMIAKPQFPWAEREHLIRSHTLLLARAISKGGLG